jgi:Uma2 family endonuclease
MSTPEKLAFTYAAYVAAEAVSAIKHDYVRGEMFAMAEGTPEHAALGLAFGAAVMMQLRGKPCRVYSADLRIRVATDFAAYPDLTVVCGSLQTTPDDANAAINPMVIVEVLSDSTEAYDRGEKFEHYRQLSSLREYVLLSQRGPRIEVHRKNEHGRWELFEFFAGQHAELASLGVYVSVDDVYLDPLSQGQA